MSDPVGRSFNPIENLLLCSFLIDQSMEMDMSLLILHFQIWLSQNQGTIAS